MTDHFPSFNGLTPFVFARQAEYRGPKDIDASIVGSVHSHDYWDEVRFAQAKAVDDLYTSKATLAPCVCHQGTWQVML